MYFHIVITVRDPSAKDGFRSYAYNNNMSFTDKIQAINAGISAFDDTPDVIHVEVFEAGIANPIKVFKFEN
jgi:hypothetical protein